MPGSKKLIDILDEMNMKESDTRHRIQRKLDKLASLIFDVDRKSPELIFVNHLLEEIIEGKTPLCSCGQSKSKPYCDQTHQQFLADEDNPNSKVLWEYLTNKERYEILNGIKLDHKKINKRHIGAKPPWLEELFIITVIVM